MTSIVSAREANQGFSDILRKAAAGETVVITRRGTPIAQLAPAAASLAPDQGAAWERLMARLGTGLHLGGTTVDRDRLYER